MKFGKALFSIKDILKYLTDIFTQLPTHTLNVGSAKKASSVGGTLNNISGAYVCFVSAWKFQS